VKHIVWALVIFMASTHAAPEKVSFPSFDDATSLTGYLSKPVKQAEHKPAIVLLHGCSGMLDNKGNIRAGVAHWTAIFIEKGWVVLAVDSFNPRGHKEVCTQTERPILESRERPRDAYGALAYLQKQPFVAKDKIVLMGFSHGATGTLYAINTRDAIWKTVDKAGLRFAAAMSFYPGCTAANRNRATPGVPYGIFIGEADDWTPAAPCVELIERAKSAGLNAHIYQYPGAYHGFDVPGTTVRVRNDVRNRRNPELAKGVHVGGNDEARKAAEKDVTGFLERYVIKIKPPSL
jgi:dienelactone hydrolase